MDSNTKQSRKEYEQEEIGTDSNETPAKKARTDEVNAKTSESSVVKKNEQKHRPCKHICEIKRRQCKLSAVRGSDYCIEHIALNQQVS